MLGLSQFHGWVGQDLSRAMQSIETVEKSEREREGKQLKDQEKERPNWRILCFVKGRKESLGANKGFVFSGAFQI